MQPGQKPYVLCLAKTTPDAELLRAACSAPCAENSQRRIALTGGEDVSSFLRTLAKTGGELEMVLTVEEFAPSSSPVLDLIAASFPLAPVIVMGVGPGPAVVNHPAVFRRIDREQWAATAPDTLREAIRHHRDAQRSFRIEAVSNVELFRSLKADQIEWIADRVMLRHHHPGEVIIEAGSAANGVYFIARGEVEVIGGPERKQGRAWVLETGDCFGEMAMLTGQTRSATVVATRRTLLLFLRVEDWKNLLSANPDRAVQLSRILSTRLESMMSGVRPAPRVHCCFGSAGDPATYKFGLAFARGIAVSTERDTILVDLGVRRQASEPGQLEEAVARSNQSREPMSRRLCTHVGEYVWQLSPSDPAAATRLSVGSVLRLIDQLRISFPFVILVVPIDEGHQLLVNLAPRCDQALLITPGTIGGATRAAGVLADLDAEGRTDAQRLSIVLDTTVSPTLPRDSLQSLLGRAVHYRVNLTEINGLDSPLPSYFLRLVRRVLGISVGLVLGGGGARGWAHVGVLQVLQSAGIPIDMIGGTSAGAYIAALYAMGRTAAQIEESCIREWVEGDPFSDWTLPRTALIKGAKTMEVAKRVFGETQIEDLPMDYFAVASDLLSGKAVILDTGSLAMACLSSITLPGMCPPVNYRGMCLVDGGIMDNVPGMVMKQRGAGLVVAVNLSQEETIVLRPTDDSGIDWWGRTLRKSQRIQELLDAPGIIQILLRCLDMLMYTNVRNTNWSFDVEITPELKGHTMLSFKVGYLKMIESGRQAARAALRTLQDRLSSQLDRI